MYVTNRLEVGWTSIFSCYSKQLLLVYLTLRNITTIYVEEIAGCCMHTLTQSSSPSCLGQSLLRYDVYSSWFLQIYLLYRKYILSSLSFHVYLQMLFTILSALFYSVIVDVVDLLYHNFISYFVSCTNLQVYKTHFICHSTFINFWE